MNTQLLIDTANFLVANDKGLLAMDESTPTCNKRFAKEGIPQTQETRRAYREMIVTTPGLGACISGAIQQPALTIWHGEAANVAAAKAGAAASRPLQPGGTPRRLYGRHGVDPMINP